MIRPTWRVIASALAGAWMVLLAGCGASTLPRVEDSSTVEVARGMIAKHDYIAASELLKRYVERNAGSGQVDDAIFLLGESHLLAKEYASAELEYDRLLRDYPESDSSAAASFRLGEAYAGQSRMEDFDQEFTVKALEQYQRYLRDYPGDWRNAEAQTRIAQLRTRLARKLLNTGTLYVKLNEPAAAGVYFARVRDEFSDTALLGDAILGVAQCDALEGRRDEAIAALKELEAQFHGTPLGGRAAHERRRIEHLPATYHPPKKVHTVPLPPPTGQPQQGPQ